MENKTKVFVIIVNWNGKEDTKDCVQSLEKIDKKKCDFHIIIVDNGSADGSITELRKIFPEITVLPAGKNLGFTGGSNFGIRHALNLGADFIWLLNNDTTVDRDVLSVLDAFKDSRVGICGSKIYFTSGREFHRDRYKKSDRGKVIWYAGGIIDWSNMYASHRGVDEVDRGQYDNKVETEFVSGCSMMIKRQVFERIGLLDDRYFLYLEDLDFCLRARRAGFKIMYVPSSVLWHVNAGSTARPGNPLHEYYFTRNRLLFGFRFAPFRTKAALLRESFRFTSPLRRKAVTDWILGRFGNRFAL